MQRVAERAKKSASEIDEVKESATALGIDLDKLAELGEARQEREYLGFFKARRAEYLSNLQTLFEQLRLPDEDRDHDKLEGIIALANAADAEDAKGKLAVEIKSAERLIEAFESHISSRQDEVANEVITDAHIADQE